MSDFYFNPSTQTTTGLSQAKADTLYLIKGSGTDNLNSNVNVNAGLNINSNLLANSLSITPVELSYLDGANSNIQTQINNISAGGTSNIGTITTNNQPIANNDTLNVFSSKTNTQLTNLSTINTNNGITSSTNIIGSIDYLQSQINNLPNGSGSGQSYFLTNTTSTVDNQYKTISTIPANGTNEILTTGTITSTTPQQLMGQFISVSPLNITSIPAGIYDFNFYASITNNNLSSYLIIEFYKLSSNLTQTLLFTMTGLDINSSIIIPYNVNSTQPAFNVNLTDYIMIKIYGKTTSTQNVIINIDYNSNNNYSHFHIPFILKSNHNDLLNIQGGATNDYQHLTTQQLNNINNPSSINNNGYLLNTDFITFNNKEPAINKNTAFNRDFETLATNIKMDGIQSVGASNNIARSDHIHPSDTTKENLIIATNTNQWFRGDKVFSNLPVSNSTTDGILTASNWNTFNNKQNTITQGTVNQYFKGDFSLGNNSDFLTPRNGIIYVNGILGDDTFDGLSIGRAYKTITAALNNTYVNSGFQIVIYPFSYTGDITISQNNLSIVGTNNEIGGIINLNLNITITSNSTSIRLCSLTTLGITISGSANVYLKDCNINGNLTKSGSGYLSINNIIMGITNSISIQGAGNCNILNGCQLGSQFTVNNSSAIVVVMNNQYITNVILTAGLISIFQTVIYGKSTTPAFNCCTVSGTNNALYLNNCDLIDSATNNQYIISVASLNYYSLRNCYMNYSGSTLNGLNLSRSLYFDDLYINGRQAVDVSRVQTLANKTLLSAKLGIGNIIQTSNNNNITFVDSSDTIVNLNTNQILTNKQLTTPTLTTNIIKGATGGDITFLDTTDTIVNLSSVQTLSNKTLVTPFFINSNFRSGGNRLVYFPDENDTLVNQNSVQTLTNKTLTNCDSNTQLTANNSTKIATTAYVKNCLSTPNTYVKTTYSSDSITVGTTNTDIVSITVDVAGTYEFNMNINANTNGYILANLYNVSTSTEVPNSLFQIVSVVNITGNIGCNTTKNMIIENIPAGTIYKIRALRNGTSSTIYNNSTNGYTYLSYKMLGITTNVPLTNRWGTVGTIPFFLTFDDYTLHYQNNKNLNIKKTIGTQIYVSFQTPLTASGFTAPTLTNDTYSRIVLTDGSYAGAPGEGANFRFTDGTKTYSVQIVCITDNVKYSLTVQSLI